MLQGSLRLFGATPIRERGEITRPLLLAMVKTLNPNLHDDINIIAAFTVAFAAFLRPAEFTWRAWDSTVAYKTHLSRGSITFTSEGVILHLPSSKTDPFARGSTIPLAHADDKACPVQALQCLFQKYLKPNNHPLFTRLAGVFNRSWLEQAIQRSILNTGHNPAIYSGHSFRRGAANSAIDAGITRDEIKELGRWKSNAVDRYLTSKSSNKIRFAANCKLHLASSTQ